MPRGILDLLAGNSGGKIILVRWIDTDAVSRQKKGSRLQPSFTVHDHVLDGHGVVVEDYIVHFAKFSAVGSAHCRTTDIARVIRNILVLETAAVGHSIPPALLFYETGSGCGIHRTPVSKVLT